MKKKEIMLKEAQKWIMQFLTSKALSRKRFEQRKKKRKLKNFKNDKKECLSTEKEWKMRKIS